MNSYHPQKIEKKWQIIWEKTGIYKTPDKIKGKKNFYSLVMFPYPSGDLHMGHWFNFVGGDVYTRFKRFQGFNVLHPIGFDAFGLPAENAAIKRGIHPRIWTYSNIQRMRKQLNSIGVCYDWSREIITSDPGYYKWTQWMFLQFYKAGLAYRAKVPANFCPSCKTVLANEQVIEGKCERCDSQVVQREIEQWLFKITEYAEKLLEDLDDLDWPETSKIVQKNWVGRSVGKEIKFPLLLPKTRIDTNRNTNQHKYISVFTTRADTLFGCTYLVLAPEHPFVASLLKIKNQKSKIKNIKAVENYIEESKKKTERERISEIKEKTGIELKGIKAVNPANGREIPIFVADYVLVHYGTGAIMSVPAHDQRDFDFAKCYNLPIREVIAPLLRADLGRFEKAYEGEGILINSGRFTGMKSEPAKERIGEFLAKKGLAKKAVCYKLKDWLISRQRYWGTPIPMIFCQKCGWQPIKEKDLPVLLPEIKDFRPTGEGKSPLAKAKEFVETTCPKCGGSAERETDTMDTFVCSSWYYLRYVDPRNEKKFGEKKKIKTWLPVNMYIGGKEHITMHLLYARFFAKALKDMDYLDFNEPFLALRHQGTILGPDDQKMSKSRGNIVEPEAQLKKYGTDVVRLYLCFMGSYEQGGPWNPKGIEGVARFLRKIYQLANKKRISNEYKMNINLERLLHKTIKKVTEDIENFKFNTAISSLMILVNELAKQSQLSIVNCQLLLKLLAPFAPHLAEELWQKIKQTDITLYRSKFRIFDSIHNQSWPKYDPKLVKEEIIQLIIQVNGKVRDKLEAEADISKEKAKELAISREKVQKLIEGKQIKKIIFVPKKLVNIVV